MEPWGAGQSIREREAVTNECNTWLVSANSSKSNNEGRAKALLPYPPESTWSSLKFTACLLTEDTWQAFAQANSLPHTTSCCCLNWALDSQSLHIQNQDSWSCADLWRHPFLSVQWRCRCWTGNCWNKSIRWRLHLSCHVSICFVNPCVLIVRVLQITTWSPSRAPPFLPGNWWPDYVCYWET